MKTTLELPDDLMRRIKIRSVERGITMTAFFVEAAERALTQEAPDWRSAFGAAKLPREDAEKLAQDIQDEFRRPDPQGVQP